MEAVMQNPTGNYWQKRLQDLKKALEHNNFEAYIAETSSDAKDIVFRTLLPRLSPRTMSWGGSVTLAETGIQDALLNETGTGIGIINPYAAGLTKEEAYEIRRKALLADLFFTGTNAVTEEGRLVNLDGFGNRVSALHFGPANVVVVAGRNKIVPGIEEAMMRIKNFAAPVNVMRLDKKTPCLETSVCADCCSPDRICNVWTITEKSFPAKRIKVILVNQDLGY
jgi:L-lactate utilization protein LutB